MEMKYSLLMPYHKRHQQFAVTLSSLVKLYSGRSDFEVLVGVDVKNDQDDLDKLSILMKTYDRQIPVYTYSIGTLNCWNPSRIFNHLAQHAKGEYLIITNPECLHETDILAGLDEEFERNSHCYVVCACRIPTGQWFQHSVHRPVKVHFCSVLSRKQYMDIDGFDEEYSKGVCFEDDDFRNKIEQAGIEIVQRDDLLVMHQHHFKSKPKEYTRLHQVNKLYYEKKWGSKCFKTENLSIANYVPLSE